MSEHIGDTGTAANCTSRAEQCDVKQSLPLKKAILVIRQPKIYIAPCIGFPSDIEERNLILLIVICMFIMLVNKLF